MVLSALGIIMVVDAHTWNGLSLFSNIFPYNSFFMPMFFFISGYFNKVGKDTKLTAYIARKFRSLMLPYAAFSAVLFVLELIMNRMIKGTGTADLPGEMLLGFMNVFMGVPSSILSPMWFIHSLFVVLVVYAVIKKLLGKRWNSFLMLGLFFLLGLVSVYISKHFSYNEYPLLCPLLKCFFALPFIELGIIYRDHLETRLASFLDLEYMTGFISPYLVTPFISSIIGILFWVTVVDVIYKPLGNNKIINYISENTMRILSLHLFFFNILNCILLIIHRYIAPLKDFAFEEISWYRWEPIPQFKLMYFIFGLLGPLLVKLLYDKVRSAMNKK